MERLSIDEIIEHCNRQLNSFYSGIRNHQENESTRAYLQMLRHYQKIGTVEEFAAYKQTVDYAKAKVKEIQDRIDARAGDNYHDETKRTLILEERQGAYITILEAAEAALAAKEEQG